MCSVVIIERPNSCQVVCECGYDRITRYAPDRCPQCGRNWDERHFEESAPAPAGGSLPFGGPVESSFLQA